MMPQLTTLIDLFKGAVPILRIESMTIAGNVKTAIASSPDISYMPKDSDYTISCNVKNSSILLASRVAAYSSPYISSFSHSYNNLNGVSHCYYGTSAGTGERCNGIYPKYDISTYGKGAYLVRPSNLKGKGENGAVIKAKFSIVIKTEYSPIFPYGHGPWKTEFLEKPESVLHGRSRMVFGKHWRGFIPGVQNEG